MSIDPAIRLRLKRALMRVLMQYVVNPLPRSLLERGLAPRIWALLETTGRVTGQARRTPVGNGLDTTGRTFWIVAEHGRRAGYVRNIEANPRVRVKVRGRWRSGVAQILPADDPLLRQRTMPGFNAALVRALGTDLLTVRIDLDP